MEYTHEEIIEKLRILGHKSEWDNMPDSIVSKLEASEKYGITVALEYDVSNGLQFTFGVPNSNDTYDFHNLSIEEVFELTDGLSLGNSRRSRQR
jgi:hypothetical protein